MKKIISLVLAAALILSFAVNASAVSKEFETAKESISKITAGWNLGNTLDARANWIAFGARTDTETCWGNPKATSDMIKAIKNAGFNAVRVPVTYYNHIDNDGNIDKSWLDRVEEVVNYVLSNDMYCIINVHHDTGDDKTCWLNAVDTDYDFMASRYENIWQQVSKRFKDYDGRLMFESFNEILDAKKSWGASTSTGYTAVNKLNQLFVDTIRASGGNNKKRNLVVNTYAASGSEASLSNFILPTDTVKNHLIIQVHNYTPNTFTFKDVTWATPTDKWDGTVSEKNTLTKEFDILKKYSDKYDVPIIIGEWGSVNKNNTEARARHAAFFASATTERGIKCFVWDDGGDMKLLDRQKCTFVYPEIIEAIIKNSGATPPAVELTAPTLTATKSSKNITLKWNAVEGAKKYYIYLYNAEENVYNKIATVTGLTKTFKNLSNGTYKYKIRAVADTKGPISKLAKITIK